MENKNKSVNPPISGYIALFAAIIIFSGIFASFKGPLKILDFSTLAGQFGKIAGKDTFRGIGGAGAKDGFLFAFTLAPMIMTALGIIRVVEGFGGLEAGAKLLTKVMKAIMGIPGCASLTLVASLTSTDAGAAMTKKLVDDGEITSEERDIFTAFQLPASATINNYFASGSALFGIMTVGEGVPLLIMLILKLVGCNIYRFIICKHLRKKEGVKQNA